MPRILLLLPLVGVSFLLGLIVCRWTYSPVDPLTGRFLQGLYWVLSALCVVVVCGACFILA
jgi:hypothetical protein